MAGRGQRTDAESNFPPPAAKPVLAFPPEWRGPPLVSTQTALTDAMAQALRHTGRKPRKEALSVGAVSWAALSPGPALLAHTAELIKQVPAPRLH